MATVSPAVTRTSRPGSNPSYVQDLKVRPAPNSTGDAVALKVCLRSGSAGAGCAPPASLPFAADPAGPGAPGWPPSREPAGEQAASSPEPAAAIPAPSTARRVGEV
ncbi:hypothetical protein GCM10010280_59170 [Streptomyces pilosus]|uniref:Uncharacterized protein n=1 Tax=Streptomyces pilosus TaxID=28893 RepID=A0A918C2A4_9ACTN|nr:hypothetical protein GCM10010280_59170 [Streptomyces pilosus]